MKRLILALLSLGLGACSVLQPKPDVTRNYLLTPEAPTQIGERADVSLAIGPIAFPSYLARAEIVTRFDSNELHLSPIHRWAEPLERNFTRVLGADLAAAIGSDEIIHFPWFGRPDVDYRLTMNVERFEATDKGDAVLVAGWKLQRELDGDVVEAERSNIRVAIDGSTTDAAVGALSVSIAKLAEEIAASIPPEE